MASRAIVSKRKENSKTGENFKVALRVRPLIAREVLSNAAQCVVVDDENRRVTITKPETRRRQSRIGIDDFGELVRSDTSQSHDFFYDAIFSEMGTQDLVFDTCVKDIVESVLHGYNGSIIASGQTGSGKTYTIEGGEGETKGIIPRATELIFNCIIFRNKNLGCEGVPVVILVIEVLRYQLPFTNSDLVLVNSSYSSRKAKAEVTSMNDMDIILNAWSDIEHYPNKSDRFLVRTAFLEIYNEKISDLMDPSRENLRIREDGAGGVFVEGLSEHVVRSTGEIMQLLREGAHLRTTASTKMNKESSRSHAVFTIIVEHGEYDSTGESIVTIGKLRMVDLAGSERLDMEAQSRQQEETRNINVSLHTFGKVVAALTTAGTKHIPYRDSKLTRLLQDCLGGNCKTTLIATITPVSSSYIESLNTLKFAKRAKNIKNTASVNQDISQKALLSSYQQEIKKLKQLLEQRDSKMDDQDLERLEQDVIKARQEKDEVLSKLKEQQEYVLEARNEKETLLSKISQLEKMLLHGQSASESDEFKQALEREQARIRTQTEKEFQSKMAELEAERKKLLDEKEEIQKQKEYFAKMRTEFQPDGGKDDYAEHEQVPALMRSLPSSVHTLNFQRKASLPVRPPPSGAQIPLMTHYQKPRRVASADALTVESSLEWAQTPTSYNYEESSALQGYVLALAHPSTGIPCQVVSSGVRIFTGAECVKWFMKNMVGVTSMQVAQDVGQRLMDLNVFIEIQGRRNFIISESVYYQFCEANPTAKSSHTSRHHSIASVQFAHHNTDNSHSSHFDRHRGSVSSLASYSSRLNTPSSLSLNQSIASLHLQGDLLEQFGLNEFQPTELHVVALYGDRQRMRVLIQELSPDCLDTAGHTPLMYAVFGRQAKSCLQLLRLGVNVNAANQDGLTPLLIATTLAYDDVIKLLLKHGAQTHFTNQQGQTAFHLAAGSQNVKCLEYICKYAKESHGINDRDHHYLTPLHMAVKSEIPVNVKQLLAFKAELGSSDENGRTALHYAVSQNSTECAHAIIDAVPNDINLVDKLNGSSALHLASSLNNMDMVSLLASCRTCDFNLRDKDGCTALHIAVTMNNSHVVKLLISKGLDATIKDNTGRTAEQLSYDLGSANCLDVLATVHADHSTKTCYL